VLRYRADCDYYYYYVAVCSAAPGASLPTEGGEGREHIVAAAHLQLVIIINIKMHR